MNENIIEYYPNGELKHKIMFYSNGSKWWEQYYDQNGKNHREASLPDFHSWHQNGYASLITYCTHGNYHNISNPAEIWYNENGKIESKFYYINGNWIHNKLYCNNNIKQIEI